MNICNYINYDSLRYDMLTKRHFTYKITTYKCKSAKAKSYNVLRTLGFGKKDISLLLFTQVFTVIAIQCILGIALGALGCFIF